MEPSGLSSDCCQVVSSSNVGGSVLCFLNGGLNYQIEHHLFPRVSHTHYPKIAPIVRSAGLEKNDFFGGGTFFFFLGGGGQKKNF